jgi:hypothetical protein
MATRCVKPRHQPNHVGDAAEQAYIRFTFVAALIGAKHRTKVA